MKRLNIKIETQIKGTKVSVQGDHSSTLLQRKENPL